MLESECNWTSEDILSGIGRGMLFIVRCVKVVDPEKWKLFEGDEFSIWLRSTRL